MKTLARITAVILIVFGILVSLGGLTMGVIGIVRAGSRGWEGAASTGVARRRRRIVRRSGRIDSCDLDCDAGIDDRCDRRRIISIGQSIGKNDSAIGIKKLASSIL